MMCPNLKNPQVAQEFNELTQAVGEKAAYDIWNQNNGYGIESAPNGAPSKLFSDLLSEFDGNRELTIKAKAKTFSKEFKTWFGDWTNVKSVETEASTRLVDRLHKIINSKDKYGKLAKILLENDAIPYNLKYFKIDNNRDDVEYAGGLYVNGPNLRLIEVLGNNFSESSINRALLHELLHSNTDKLLEDYKKDPSSVSEEQRINIKKLYDVIMYAKDYLLKNYNEDKFIEILNRQSTPVNTTLFYAFNHNDVNEIDEFISELFTNPGFQEVLNDIPYKESNISLWDKIIEAISNIFGFDIKKGSVLEEALKYSTDLIKSNWNVVNDFNLSNIDTSIVDVELEDKPWKNDSSKVNKTIRIYLKGEHEKGYFELVKDKEPFMYSVHFKTGDANTGETYGSVKEERDILYKELIKAIPEGAQVSTWGELSTGGINALNKVGNSMIKVGERQVKNREGNDILIPIYQKGTILGDKESDNFEIVDLSPNYDDGGESSIFTVKYKKDIKKDIPLKDRKTKVSQEYDYLQKLRDNDIKKVNDLTEDEVELTKDGNLHIKDTATTIYIKRLGLNSLSEYKEYEINKITSERSDDTLLKQAESSVPQYEESNQFIDVTIDTSTGQMSGNIGSVAIELPEQLRGRGLGKELYLLLNKYLYNTKQITLKSDPLGTSEKAHHVWESFRKAGKATLISGNSNDFKNGFYTAKYELNPPQQVTTSISKVVDENGEPLIVYHGSDYIFTQFSLDTKNRANMTDLIKKGIYFSNERAIADSYAHSREERTNNSVYKLIEEINALRGIITDPYFEDAYGEFEGFDTYEKHMSKYFELAEDENALWFTSLYKSNVEKQLPNAAEILKQLKLNNYDKAISLAKENIRPTYHTVYPVFLNFRNPIQINTDYSTISTAFSKHDENQLNSAESIIVKNVDDGIHEYTLRISNTYIAFNPNQIKSATENVGSFDYEKSNIYEKLGSRNNEYSDAMEKTILNNVFNGFTTPTNNSKVIQTLIDNGAFTTKRLNKLANLLMKIDGNTVFVKEDDLIEDALMQYDKIDGQVELCTSKFGKYNSIEAFGLDYLHEVVHHYTIRALDPKLKHTQEEIAFAKSMNKLLAEARILMKETKPYKIDKKGNAIWKTYGLTNVYEFASEMLTNLDFRRSVYLFDKDMNLSLWDKFKKLIAILLGGPKLEISDSKLVREATDLVTDFITYENKIGGIDDYMTRLQKRDESTIEDIKSDIDRAFAKVDTNSQLRRDLITKSRLTLKNIESGINSRIKSLRTYPNSERIVKELENQLISLSQLKEAKAIVSFIESAPDDLERHRNYILDSLDKVDKGLVSEIDDAKLMQFKHDYFGFYEPLIGNVAELNRFDKGIFQFENKEDEERFSNILTDLVSNFTLMDDALKNVLRIKAEYNLNKIGITSNSPTMDSYTAKEFLSKVGDMGFAARHIFSTKSSTDEALRAVHRALTDAKQEVSRSYLSKGKDLMKLQHRVSNPMALFEVDKDGKRTGYLIRSLNYGSFRNDYNKFIKELNDKYGLKQGEFPTDDVTLVKYRTEKNKYLAEHAERRFTKDYYEVYNKMSINTEMARNDIHGQIYKILNKVTDEEGNVNREDLSDADWYSLRNLYREKKALASTFNTDGSIKSGDQLDIANNLSEINKAIQDKLRYKVNIDKFNELLEKKKIQYKDQPAKLEKWLKRNTRTVYSQEFWDQMSNLDHIDYGKNYEALAKARTELLAIYRDDKFQVDMDDESVRDTIRALDKALAEERARNKGNRGISTIKFTDIATMEKSDQYTIDMNRAMTKGKEFYEKWYNDNHFKDDRGRIQPNSYYTYIKPKNKKYISIEPSAMFQEIDQDSPFFNNNFDATDPNSVQPKRSKYDNSKAYDKVMSNQDNVNLYNALRDNMAESNAKIPFLATRDPHMLPQISGSAYDHIMSAGFKGLGHYIKDKFTINNDDADYAINEALMRPDKSKLKFIPTHYISRLEHPETISTDIVGMNAEYFRMAENYSKMAQIAPTMETILEAIGQRTVTKKETSSKKAEELIGTKSAAYAKLEEFLGMNLYGEQKKELWSPSVFGTKLSFSKILGGISNYSQVTMLGWNIYSAGAGILTAKALNLSETISNRFYGPKDYAKALGICTLNLPGMLASTESETTTNKVIALMEYTGIVFNDEEMFKSTQRSRVMKVAGRVVAPMTMWTIADVSIKAPILVATMLNHKLYNGEFISRRNFIKTFKGSKRDANRIWNALGETLYDAFEVKDGKFQPKEQYKNSVSVGLMTKVRNINKYITARIDGVLNDMDKTAAQRNSLLRFVFMFRSFLVSNWEDRLVKKKQWNYMIEDFEEAQYIAAAKTVSKFFRIRYDYYKGIIDKEQMKRSIPYYQKYAFKKTAIELGIMAGLFAIGEYMKGIADKDKKDLFKQYTAYLSIRTLFEMAAMYNPADLLSMLKSVSPITTMIDQLTVLIGAMIPDVDQEGTKTTKRIVKGPYKGQQPYQRALWKLTPAKNIWEWGNAQSKREYLESQLMKRNK